MKITYIIKIISIIDNTLDIHIGGIYYKEHLCKEQFHDIIRNYLNVRSYDLIEKYVTIFNEDKDNTYDIKVETDTDKIYAKIDEVHPDELSTYMMALNLKPSDIISDSLGNLNDSRNY